MRGIPFKHEPTLFDKIQNLKDIATTTIMDIYYLADGTGGNGLSAETKMIIEQDKEQLHAKRAELSAAKIPPVLSADYESAQKLCDAAAKIEAMAESFFRQSPTDAILRLLSPEVSKQHDKRIAAWNKNPAPPIDEDVKPQELAEEMFIAAGEDETLALLLQYAAPIVLSSPPGKTDDFSTFMVIYIAYANSLRHPAFLASMLTNANVYDGKTVNGEEYTKLIVRANENPVFEKTTLKRVEEAIREARAEIKANRAQEPIGADKKVTLADASAFAHRMNEMEEEVSNEMTGVYHLIVVSSKLSATQHSGACDAAILSLTLTSLRLDNLIEDYEPVSGKIIGIRPSLDNLKSQMTAAIAAIPVIREMNFENAGNAIAALDIAAEHVVCKNEKKSSMEEEMPFYGIETHLSLLTEDALYRNLFFTVLWHFEYPVINDEVLSIIAELYKDAKLPPVAILSLLAMAKNQLGRLKELRGYDEDDVECIIDLESFRQEGWRLSNDETDLNDFITYNKKNLASALGLSES